MTVKKTKTTKKIKNPWKLTAIPLHSWLIFWVLVLTTMALATVSFADAFKNGEGEVDQETVAAFEAIRKNLEAQVEDLQGKVGVEMKVPAGRMLVSGVPGPGAKEKCDLLLATSTADLYVLQVNEATGLRGSFPYSFAWGNQNYAFEPVVTIGEGSAQTLLFGPGVVSNCSINRDSALEITKSTSTPNEVRREALNAFNTGSVRERSINGMTVLSFKHNTEASQNLVWVAFGRTYRYTIYSLGWLTDAEAIKIIQSLRVEK